MIELRAAIRSLRKHHGPPERPPTDDPFELILLENVAYLPSPEGRRKAFAQLRAGVGTTPIEVASATDAALGKVTRHGILAEKFAGKLRECGRIALERFHGDLGAAVGGDSEKAKRALRAFPGIGEPGAEKILLFAGKLPALAPDSNALRVLARLGLIVEHESYAKTYAAAREAARALPQTVAALQEAHLLLQLHGRTLCTRARPRCDACPLVRGCAYARTLRKPAAASDES